MFNEYIMGALGAAVIAAGGWGYVQDKKADRLEQQVRDARAVITAMEARLGEIEEDRASDAEIDNADIDELRRRAAEWMRDAPASTSP